MDCKEIHKAHTEFCSQYDDKCTGCPYVSEEFCYLSFAYDKGQVCDLQNPYWRRITQMADRQREKGIKTYGQGLEQFTTPDALKRIEYIQEELIDALMYLEWLKDILKGETNNGTEKETRP